MQYTTVHVNKRVCLRVCVSLCMYRNVCLCVMLYCFQLGPEGAQSHTVHTCVLVCL